MSAASRMRSSSLIQNRIHRLELGDVNTRVVIFWKLFHVLCQLLSQFDCRARECQLLCANWVWASNQYVVFAQADEIMVVFFLSFFLFFSFFFFFFFFWRGIVTRGKSMTEWLFHMYRVSEDIQLTATFVWPYQRDPYAPVLRPGRSTSRSRIP
jgi:hypothetical protein